MSNIVNLPPPFGPTPERIALARMAPHVDAFDAGLAAARIARRLAIARAKATFAANVARLEAELVNQGNAAMAAMRRAR